MTDWFRSAEIILRQLKNNEENETRVSDGMAKKINFGVKLFQDKSLDPP